MTLELKTITITTEKIVVIGIKIKGKQEEPWKKRTMLAPEKM